MSGKILAPLKFDCAHTAADHTLDGHGRNRKPGQLVTVLLSIGCDLVVLGVGEIQKRR